MQSETTVRHCSLARWFALLSTFALASCAKQTDTASVTPDETPEMYDRAFSAAMKYVAEQGATSVAHMGTWSNLADVTIIDRDITKIPRREIENAHIVTTIVAGKVVYTRPEGSPR